MSGQEEKKIFALAEQADVMAKTAMTQQEVAKEALKELREAVQRIQGMKAPLARQVSEEVASAVSDTVMNAAKQQLGELSEAAAAAERAAVAAKNNINDKFFYGASLIALAGFIALAVVYAGTRWTYTAVTAERNELTRKFEYVQQAISDRKKTLEQLENKTWGIELIEQDGKRFVVLGEGHAFSAGAYTSGKRKAFEIIRQGGE